MGVQEVDIVAVQQDAAAVHALATRAFDEVDMHDPAVAILAAWVTQIDSGVDASTRFVMPQTPPSGSSTNVMPASRGRRSALIAGSTVFALVVSGGAAAAVTGDPLAMVRAPLHALGKANPFADDAPGARDRLPEPAPTTAVVNKLLADALRAMANGQITKAEKLLDEATALLGETVNPGQQNRIDKLNGELPGQADPNGKGPGDTPVTDPKGKGPGNIQTTDPSGSPKGESGKPARNDASNKGSGTGSGKAGKAGSGATEGPGSSRPADKGKSSPQD